MGESAWGNQSVKKSISRFLGNRGFDPRSILLAARSGRFPTGPKYAPPFALPPVLGPAVLGSALLNASWPFVFVWPLHRSLTPALIRSIFFFEIKAEFIEILVAEFRTWEI